MVVSWVELEAPASALCQSFAGELNHVPQAVTLWCLTSVKLWDTGAYKFRSVISRGVMETTMGGIYRKGIAGNNKKSMKLSQSVIIKEDFASISVFQTISNIFLRTNRVYV